LDIDMSATGDPEAAAAVTLVAPGRDPDDPAHGKRLLHGLISLAILVALVTGLVLAVPGLKGVQTDITHMDGGWLAVGLALEIMSCLGYVVAFLQVFERAPIRFGARVALTEQAFGAAVSLGGAGSVTVGAWMLISRGGDTARVAERSAVLFLLTSAVNVIVLAVSGVVLFTGVVPGPSDPLLSALPAAVAIAVLLFFWFLPALVRRDGLQRLPPRVGKALEVTVASVEATRRYLFTPDWRTLGAFAYLLCDIGVLIVCLKAADASMPIVPVILAYQIGYMANLLPIPGNIGVLDGSLVGMLVLYGGNATRATAATVVYHAIALWIPATWGTIAFIVLQKTRHKPIELRPPRAERRAAKRANQ
jgi:uncharacterized membrane protein YbhN (UPF0104 family)